MFCSLCVYVYFSTASWYLQLSFDLPTTMTFQTSGPPAAVVVCGWLIVEFGATRQDRPLTRIGSPCVAFWFVSSAGPPLPAPLQARQSSSTAGAIVTSIGRFFHHHPYHHHPSFGSSLGTLPSRQSHHSYIIHTATTRKATRRQGTKVV